MGFSVRLWFLYECFEMVLFWIETYRSVVNLPLIVVYCLLNPNHIMCSFDVNLRVIVMKWVLAAPSELQVWSQTQLYSVGFRQSRITVKIVILQTYYQGQRHSHTFWYQLLTVFCNFCTLSSTAQLMVSLFLKKSALNTFDFFRDRDKGVLLQETKDTY